MSFFFGDSFDLYAQATDASANYWDTVPSGSTSTLVAGRFSGSRALNVVGNPNFTKTSGVNDAVHHFNFAYMQSVNTTSSNIGFFIELFDGATAQCSVAIRGDGAIILTLGAPTSGSNLAVYTGAITVGTVWTMFEIEVTIHNTNGTFKVWKNGNPNPDFSVVGTPGSPLNTRASGNNYANKISIGVAQTIGSSTYIDDFLWRSDASGGSWMWIGDIRCYTRHPVSDAKTPEDFSRTTAAVNAQMWAPIGVQQSLAASQAEYMQFTASYSGLLTGVIFGPGSNGGTGHIKAAVFSSVSGAIGSVLAVTSELTNPTSLTLSFPTPAYLVAGQTYWIGVINDSGTVNLNVVTNPAPLIALSTTPYASWPVSSPGGTLGSFNAPGLTLIMTPQSNSDSVGELQQDGTTNYVYSSTNGQNDLYTIGPIGATPLQIFGVVTRGFFEKSDSGTRNATVQLKSGGTTVQGPDTALTTSAWNWISRLDLTDPATSATWTVSGVNAVQVGPRVTA